MKKYYRYLKYLIYHKWFVMTVCFKFGIYWQGIVHDWHKFTPKSMKAYANYFYKGDKAIDVYKEKGYIHEPGYNYNFDLSWLHHIHHSPHHWQYWILKEDNGDVKYLPMPKKYILEMVADWYSAGRAQGNSSSCQLWYDANKYKIKIHEKTRYVVEDILSKYNL